MLSLLKWIIKSAIFAAIVLVIANLVKWDGKTISDQVKTQLAHAERAELTTQVKNWAGSVTKDARTGAARKPALAPQVDHIGDSERQKLRALIRELNTAPDAD